MRKFLLWAAAVTFSFAAFLTSCATQPQADDRKAPAPATHKKGAGQSMLLSGFALRSANHANPAPTATIPTA